MPWNETHKEESRSRILDTAARLFALHGFERISIDQLMREAGMTRGAFYAHFNSKAELYSEAVVAAASRNGDGLRELPLTLTELLAGYLSQEHLNGEGPKCPMAFLVTDVAHRDQQLRSTYTEVFRSFVEMLKPYMTASDDRQQRDNAMRTAVQMIGGMAIARALSDDALAELLLQACRQPQVASDQDARRT